MTPDTSTWPDTPYCDGQRAWLAGEPRHTDRPGGACDGGGGEWYAGYDDASTGRFYGPPICRWFALCDRPAAGTTAHSILGAVQICQPCADRFDLTVQPFGAPSTIESTDTPTPPR